MVSQSSEDFIISNLVKTKSPLCSDDPTHRKNVIRDGRKTRCGKIISFCNVIHLCLAMSDDFRNTYCDIHLNIELQMTMFNR